MNMTRLIDAFGGWWYRSALARNFRKRWYRSRLGRLFRRWWYRTRSEEYRYKPSHLYEVVLRPRVSLDT